jgi:hypothetical protein
MDLITLDEYKLSQGLSDVKNDDRIQTLVTSVSQLVKTYCATTFVDYYATPLTETFSVDFETDIIQLRETPVITITSVEERPSYSGAYAVLTEADFQYYLDPNTDSLYRTHAEGSTDWAMGPGAVKVIYTGGFENIPGDLRLAVIDTVKYYYKEEYKERRSLSGASISNNPTSTQWKNVGFPDHIKRVLDLYKQLQM